MVVSLLILRKQFWGAARLGLQTATTRLMRRYKMSQHCPRIWWTRDHAECEWCLSGLMTTQFESLDAPNMRSMSNGSLVIMFASIVVYQLVWLIPICMIAQSIRAPIPMLSNDFVAFPIIFARIHEKKNRIIMESIKLVQFQSYSTTISIGMETTIK